MKTAAHKHQKGSISIIVAVSLVALLGILGLAIDSGLGYMIRARLDAATDGAVVAAGQAVTRGNNQSEQTTNATQAANAFFTANYPAGFLGSTATAGTPSVVFDNKGTVTINMSAQAQVPVTFMQTLGFKVLNVGASSQAIRKTLDMAFVIDTTGSMATDPTEPPVVQANATSFLNSFDITNDRVALMHFAYGTIIDTPFKKDSSRGFDRATMTAQIQKYNFSGSTNSSEAFWNARNQMNQLQNPSSLRVIVFFSDGAPNSFASAFTFAKQAKACNNLVGTIASPDSNGKMTGLWHYDQLQTAFSSPCYDSDLRADSSKFIPSLPAFYNAHNPTDTTFPIITNSPRVVTAAVTYQNVNRASRNLLEAMAADARNNNIYVFTLGLGQPLVQPAGPDNELGQDVLKCMANTPDSLPRCYNPKQPVGVYCHAATPADLAPCFSQLASQILRISQ
ncbi:TadE/TadG family type IV pilus assembly protein [Paraburkholderia sp. RL17-337-BIB-A]|uniref:TadE/TadG family type IV pilus assembly protein n=1 Tax=Paraburkholderia sp. RL17-337-BIB-A TaxID=3031636 RepID=UPI0038B9D815